MEHKKSIAHLCIRAGWVDSPYKIKQYMPKKFWAFYSKSLGRIHPKHNILVYNFLTDVRDTPEKVTVI